MYGLYGGLADVAPQKSRSQAYIARYRANFTRGLGVL